MLRSGLRVLFPFSSPSLFSFPLRLCSSSSSCRYSCLKGHTLYGTANGSTKGYLHCGFLLSPSDLWIRPRSGRENAAQIFSGSHGRVPTQTQETDDEHLSEIVSYFLSIRYFFFVGSFQCLDILQPFEAHSSWCARHRGPGGWSTSVACISSALLRRSTRR